jgi:prepilin-type N-terminal cleavage/methylation domain-containing protein
MLHSLQTKHDEKGFTLIELLIVIVVIGILSAIVLFAVGNAKSDADKAACQADYRTVKSAQEAYKASPSGGNGSYAANIAALTPNFLKSDPGTYVTANTGLVTRATGKCASGPSD